MTSQCISLQRASHVIASQATSAHNAMHQFVETLPTPLRNTSRWNYTNTSTQQNAQCIDCINWLEHKTDGSRISSQEAFQGNSKCGQDYNLLEQHWGRRHWPSYDAAMHQLFRFTASLGNIWARFSAKSCLVEARWQNDGGTFQGDDGKTVWYKIYVWISNLYN